METSEGVGVLDLWLTFNRTILEWKLFFLIRKRGIVIPF